MARYKEYCYERDKLIPVSFSRQIMPGTFEHALSHLIVESWTCQPSMPVIRTTRPVCRPVIRGFC